MCAPRKIVVGWRRAQGPGGRGTGDSRENRRAAIYPIQAAAAAPDGAIAKTPVRPAASCAACRPTRRDLWTGGLGISGPGDLRDFAGELARQAFREEDPSSNIQAPEKLQVLKIKIPRIAGTLCALEPWCLVFLWSLVLGIWSLFILRLFRLPSRLGWLCGLRLLLRAAETRT